MAQCPCGSGKDLDKCCGPYVKGEANAPTAEALMRSRYTAYVINETDYIGETLHPEHRADHDPEGVKEWAETAEWLGLEVLDTVAGREQDLTGEVAFNARFNHEGTTHEHREHARFVKEDDKWYYVDGAMLPQPTVVKEAKIGRNEKCPCGSGKKYKKCCMNK